ncbi:MAG: phosphate signaling complex protein PhoU [Cloacibacillus sp.]
MNTINPRKRIEEDLASLKSMVYRMSGLASESLEKSVWALKTRDEELSKTVLEEGDIIDALEERIDESCMEFAARYQPLGEDLRVVVSLMHIAVDIERIGDYAENIAKVTLSLAGKPPIKPLIDIPRMVEIIKEMLRISMRAIDMHDGAEALKVFPLDDEVDDLEKQIMRELLMMMMEKTDRIEASFKLINVAKTLERAGDHATNVAERIAYMYTGRPVKASEYRRKRME